MASYEEIRQRNIESNRKLLLSLNLAGPGSAPIIPKPKPATKTKPAASSRQSLRGDQGDDADPSLPADSGLSRRRSGRIQKIKAGLKGASTTESNDLDYQPNCESSQEDGDADSPKKRKGGPKPSKLSDSASKRRRQAPKARCLKGGRPDPKVFGHQIGVEVGDWWDSRMSCSQAGVHAPPVSGISGSETEGCWSVALSGGYEDDVDIGYAFTFTGAGGRALSGTKASPKNLRTAPQTFDQEFTSLNAALRTSSMTKKPIRVIRGYKNHSPFAPDEGYRYDGLYQVERCWREIGQAGFQVCKYAFVRLPDQPRIPVKAGRESEAEQMYKDMGFVIDQLPPPPEERPIWTKSMAADRLRVSPSSVDAKVESEVVDEAPRPDGAQMDLDEMAKGDDEAVSQGPQENSATEGLAASVLNDVGKHLSGAAQQDGEFKPEDTQPTNVKRDLGPDKETSDTGKEHEASKPEDTQPVNETDNVPEDTQPVNETDNVPEDTQPVNETDNVPRVPDDTEMDLGEVAKEDGEPMSESPQENSTTEGPAPVSNDVVKDVSDAVKQDGELKAEDIQPANAMRDLGPGKEILDTGKDHEASKPEDTQPVNATENVPRILDDAEMNAGEVVNEDSDPMAEGPQEIPMTEDLAPVFNEVGKDVSDTTKEERGSKVEGSQPAKAVEDPGLVLHHADKDISETPNEEGQSKLEDTQLANEMEDLASVLDNAQNYIGGMAKASAESMLEGPQPVDQTANMASGPYAAGIYISDAVKLDNAQNYVGEMAKASAESMLEGPQPVDQTANMASGTYAAGIYMSDAVKLDNAQNYIGETAKASAEFMLEGPQPVDQTVNMASGPYAAGIYMNDAVKEDGELKPEDPHSSTLMEDLASVLDDARKEVGETAKEDGEPKPEGNQLLSQTQDVAPVSNDAGIDVCDMVNENVGHNVVAPFLDDLDMFVRETVQEDRGFKPEGGQAINEESTIVKADNPSDHPHPIAELTIDQTHSFSDAVQSTTVQETFF